MPSFSSTSMVRLETCDIRLQDLLNEAIKEIDFSILCGHRNREAQEAAFRDKKSTLRWPNSKHNKYPSLAVDIAPYPIDWKDPARFARLYGYLERIAFEQAINIRWGGDWSMNWRTNDERLIDMPHVELLK